MGRSNKKDTRDPSKLSGKPLSETLEPSILKIESEEGWVTSPDLVYDDLPFTPEVMYDLTSFLLANPNMNSSHLFRADILFDSLGILKTPLEKERLHLGTAEEQDRGEVERVEPVPAKDVSGFELKRTVVRRLIPRNPKLDRPLEQTCHFYEGPSTVAAHRDEKAEESGPSSSLERLLVIYTPHTSTKEDLPWYHPLLRSLAFLYDFRRDPTAASTTTTQEEKPQGSGTLSLHFLPFPSEEPIPTRLERTLLALLTTQVRLARGTRPSNKTPEGGNYNPVKDNIIPQHLIQNTYLRLKLKYASDLCRDWVEETEPSKHVFEDLAITAFLIELWRDMYGVVPADGRKPPKDDDTTSRKFPGFVDVACGNGVLVYVLLMEGYQGWGFDARRRKSWSIFPQWVQERLKESIYIPKPFADVVTGSEGEDMLLDLGAETHTGTFDRDTFIISNHADELTVWTPLMAALANPESPLPFLAIPCCSHSLSGARFRYPPPKLVKSDATNRKAETAADDDDIEDEEEVEQNPQPASGDLKALRASKMHSPTDPCWSKSMYGSLTAKAMSIAEEIGYEVERTLIRIPSTRNMGVIGGRRRTKETWNPVAKPSSEEDSAARRQKIDPESLQETIVEVVRRECAREGGVEFAARVWIDRAKSIHRGQGKGNQKGAGHGH
ncbi:hypothetical protein VTN00DRAFT_8909 [Thermoascus crustaceus]|uniref:uncharacterized protein n=1 Tax=Thermoascus crustaceus TaxID=5088 RepID=UPI003744A241